MGCVLRHASLGDFVFVLTSQFALEKSHTWSRSLDAGASITTDGAAAGETLQTSAAHTETMIQRITLYILKPITHSIYHS